MLRDPIVEQHVRRAAGRARDALRHEGIVGRHERQISSSGDATMATADAVAW
jgi:hypothetical protein